MSKSVSVNKYSIKGARMNKSILEAIDSLKADIKEIQDKIDLLNNIGDEITEETYHKLCETPLRCSDLLGQLVSNQISSLTYNKRGPNYFYYNLPETDIHVRIPSSLCKGIEIVVQLYCRNPTELPRDEYINALISNKNRQIMKLEKLIYGKSERDLKYYINVMLGKKSQWKLTLKHLVEERDRIKEQYAQQVEKQQEDRRNQQQIFTKYAAEFLKWTNEIRIYEKDSNIICQTIKKTEDNQ